MARHPPKGLFRPSNSVTNNGNNDDTHADRGDSPVGVVSFAEFDLSLEKPTQISSLFCRVELIILESNTNHTILVLCLI